jgi:hypothetical protein
LGIRTTVKPNADEKLEILILEMELLQGTFAKYDDVIFRSRGWFVTVWLAVTGAALTTRAPDLTLLAAAAALIYWLFEGLMRYQYWHKYVVRYRAIRDWLNDSTSPEDISIYDLTNHYGKRASGGERFRKSFLKLEPTVTYSVMAVAALIVRLLVPT